MDINFIVHLKTFFFLARKDSRLSTCHLSLYMALFDAWNSHRFKNPFYPTREHLMATSRIGSNSTYARSMEDLHSFGYIKQEKIKGKYGQSVVAMLPLGEQQTGKQMLLFGEQQMAPKNNHENHQKEAEKKAAFTPKQGTDLGSDRVQNVAAKGSKNGTPEGSNLYPLIHKHINNKNWESKQAPAPIFFNKNFFPENSQNNALPAGENCTPKDVEKPGGCEKNVECAGEGKPKVSSDAAGKVNPSSQEVQSFFGQLKVFASTQATAKLEAAKFYNHYTAIGWKLGGINPILDWKAAARKWVLNMHEHRDRGTAPPSNTYFSTDKNYSEPL